VAQLEKLELAVKADVLREDVLQWVFVHHKSQKACCKIVPQQMEIGD
jgi:hypothetical protein